MNLSSFKCKKEINDIYVSTLDLDPAQMLRACIDLMEKMRSAQSPPTEKTIIAMSKYKNNNVCDNMEVDNELKWSEEIRGLHAWDLKFHTASSLGPEVGYIPLIHAAIMLSRVSDGGIPQPPNGQEVNNANVSVLYVGRPSATLVDIANTVEDKLAYDTAYAARAYMELACNDTLTATDYKGLTGDFNFMTINTPRTAVTMTVARGLMNKPNIVGSVTITGDKYDVEGNYDEIFSFANETIEAILKSRKMRIAVVL
ncbi:hypothetical protein ACTXT7_017291, partial [Hymenolepis weldensis]